MQILQGKEFGSTACQEKFQGVATFCVHTIAAIHKNTDSIYVCNVYHKVSNIVWWISGKRVPLSRNNNNGKLNFWHKVTHLAMTFQLVSVIDVLTTLAHQERKCKGSDPVLKCYNSITVAQVAQAN